MSDATVIAAAIAGGAALSTSLIAGGIALWTNGKINKNTEQITSFKGAVDRDVERLKSKLEHGQLISSTQWNAEFSAYQALWKSIVPVRTIAEKLTHREGELTTIGLKAGDVSEETRIANVERLIQQYACASKICVSAINEHAPFYAPDIRRKANGMHAQANVIFKIEMAAIVQRKKGQVLTQDQITELDTERKNAWRDLVIGTDAVEEMIRKRMDEVQIFNPAVV